MERFEIKTGKFGQYFFDKESGEDMALQRVATLLNAKAAATSNPVMDLVIDAADINKTLTIKGYMKELLIQLMSEQEGFSGKRPFGESGWCHSLEKAMVEAGYIEGVIDPDGYLLKSDSKDFVRKMIGAIKEL